MRILRLLILVAVAAVTLAGCDRERLVNPMAPHVAPPDSIWVEVCDTLPPTITSQGDHDLSVSSPRTTLTEYVNIVCDDHLVNELLTVDNEAGSDAKYVLFLESSPGASYKRYYFTDTFGDTLLVPNSTNGSSTTFNLACNPPSGSYSLVALYKGTVRMANAALPAGTESTLWHITVHGRLSVACIECRSIKVPKP